MQVEVTRTHLQMTVNPGQHNVEVGRNYHWVDRLGMTEMGVRSFRQKKYFTEKG